MDHFFISDLNKYFIYKILEKTEAKEFSKLFRSCRAMMNLIEEKTNWMIMVPHVTLIYCGERRIYIAYKDHNLQRIPTADSAERDGWFCCEQITFQKCETHFFNSNVIPQVRSLKAAKRIELAYQMEEAELMTLTNVLEQPKIKFLQLHYDPENMHFKKFKSLEIELKEITATVVKTFLQSVFRVAVGRKEITYECTRVVEDIIHGFLKNWLRGKSVDTLKKLTFDFLNEKLFSEMKVGVLKSLAISPDYQNYIFEMNNPGESSLGNTMSGSVVISRNPRYGSQRRLSLQFTEINTVIFEFLE